MSLSSFLNSAFNDVTPAGVLASSSGDPNGLADMLSGGAVSNAQSVAATNAANTANAQQQEQYQTQMSDTSYQRGVQDMKAAGLNPMLAYSQGGDSTPTGVSPQLQAPQTGDIGAGIASSGLKALGSDFTAAANSRAETAQQNSNDATSANISNTKAATDNTYMDTQNKEVQLTGNMKKNDILDQEKKQSEEATKQMRLKTRVNANDAKGSDMDLDLKNRRFGDDQKLQRFDSWHERANALSGTVSNAFGAANKAKSALDVDGPMNEQFKRRAKSWLWREGEVP